MQINPEILARGWDRLDLLDSLPAAMWESGLRLNLILPGYFQECFLSYCLLPERLDPFRKTLLGTRDGSDPALSPELPSSEGDSDQPSHTLLEITPPTSLH